MAAGPGRGPLPGPGLVPDPRTAIRDRALALGFDAVGFSKAALAAQATQGLADYLAAGHHGDMGWLEARSEQRGDPATLWPEAKTVVTLGLNYGPEGDALEGLEHPETGNISVYARGRDYHEVVKGKLKELARWIARTWPQDLKVFVDTAPVMEKPLAMQGGLGWQGKHTNLVSREFGSWLFLGEIYLTIDLAPDEPEIDHCGECHRCLDICPTAAFPAPYKLDARRCISYLTIEHKGPIPAELRPLMGNRIYGCDDCLAVCPWNKFAKAGSDSKLEAREDLTAPKLAELAGLDDTGFRAFFSGSPIKRIGRDRFVRNVLIAIGNSGNRSLLPAVEKRLEDASPLVRGMAAWTMAKLDPQRFAGERSHRLSAELDEDVRREWAESPSPP